MKSKMVTVVVVFKAKPGKSAPLKKKLLTLINSTRKEAGCLNYDLHQDNAEPTRFVFHENWATQAHLDTHLATPKLKALGNSLPTLLAEPPLFILATNISPAIKK